MSISQIESRIKLLQAEIEKLGRDFESEVKKETGYRKSINRTTKSITKNTSISMRKTKQRTIDSDAEKVDKSIKKQAEIQEKIGKKKIELAKKQAELQKEQNKVFQAMVKKQGNVLESQQQFISQAKVAVKNTCAVEKKYDFFISHASEDKESVAEPLARALTAKGANVWLDKFAMSVGDSLRQSIDDGLSRSRYGIVILSEIYFKKFWTSKELNGLFAKQEDGAKVILPIWHNISKDVVKRYSTILADMLALKTADFTIEEIANDFIQLIK